MTGLTAGWTTLSLKTKSIYAPKEESDGLRVLVTRYYPRGVKRDRFDSWTRELSPSKALLHSYRSGKTSWEEFESKFREEMKASTDAKETILALRKRSRDGPVTLLCYEKEGEHCHRHIVAEMISKRTTKPA